MLAANLRYSCYILRMTDMVCLACMQKLWSAWAVLGLYGILEFKFYTCSWLDHSLEEGNGQESLEQRSVSIAV